MLVFGSKLFDFDLNSNSLFKHGAGQWYNVWFFVNLDVSKVYMIVFSMQNYSIHV